MRAALLTARGGDGCGDDGLRRRLLGAGGRCRGGGRLDDDRRLGDGALHRQRRRGVRHQVRQLVGRDDGVGDRAVGARGRAGGHDRDPAVGRPAAQGQGSEVGVGGHDDELLVVRRRGERVDGVEDEVDVGAALALLRERRAVDHLEAGAREVGAELREPRRVEVARADEEPPREVALGVGAGLQLAEPVGRVRGEGLGRHGVEALQADVDVVEVDEQGGPETPGGVGSVGRGHARGGHPVILPCRSTAASAGVPHSADVTDGRCDAGHRFVMVKRTTSSLRRAALWSP